tara:strand:+ start:86 stop:2080 length:1995 start_codon:yes stop_codon:yes gene_type:complete
MNEEEGSLDRRKRIYPDYKKNRYKNRPKVQTGGNTGEEFVPDKTEDFAPAPDRDMRTGEPIYNPETDQFGNPFEMSRAEYQINRDKLNASRNLDLNRAEEQRDSLPEITMQDISELSLDAKMAMEAAKKAPGGPVIKAGAAVGAVVLRRAAGNRIKNIIEDVTSPLYKRFVDEADPYSFFGRYQTGTVGAQKRGNRNWRPNLKQFGYFPDTKDAVSQFGQNTVDNFMERARLHRVSRAQQGKKELMKDFNETLEIVRDDGTIELGMVVRRKKYGNKLDLTDSSNYHVRTLSQVMEDVRVNTGWLTQQSDNVKAMQIVRSKLNQLKTQYSDDLVLAKLMEYGDEAYLEHMVGKAQYGWLWDIKEADPTKYPWLKAPERNHVDNLRLLVSNPYKKLKDTTETRIKPLNKLLPKNKRYIINIEDPMTNPYAKENPLHKSNPGNIIIQTAKPSDKFPKTIGIVGDYLQDFYGPDFIKNYDGNKLLTIFEQLSPKDKKLYSLYKPKTYTTAGKRGSFQTVESAVKYRDRVLKERIDLIIKEQNKFSSQEIQTEVFNDLLNFYELFAGKANFVRRPQYVSDMMQKNAVKDIKFPFSKQKFDEFYRQKRKAIQDLALSVHNYEKGLTPRMTKKDYDSLWKQLTSISAMDYNFKADVNDFTNRLIQITAKYE